MIRTVYTNGLEKMVESVASKIGLSLTLPAVAEIGGYFLIQQAAINRYGKFIPAEINDGLIEKTRVSAMSRPR